MTCCNALNCGPNSGRAKSTSPSVCCREDLKGRTHTRPRGTNRAPAAGARVHMLPRAQNLGGTPRTSHEETCEGAPIRDPQSATASARAPPGVSYCGGMHRPGAACCLSAHEIDGPGRGRQRGAPAARAWRPWPRREPQEKLEHGAAHLMELFPHVQLLLSAGGGPRAPTPAGSGCRPGGWGP